MAEQHQKAWGALSSWVTEERAKIVASIAMAMAVGAISLVARVLALEHDTQRILELLGSGQYCQQLECTSLRHAIAELKSESIREFAHLHEDVRAIRLSDEAAMRKLSHLEARADAAAESIRELRGKH